MELADRQRPPIQYQPAQAIRGGTVTVASQTSESHAATPSGDPNYEAMANVYRAADIDLKGQFNWFGIGGLPQYDFNAAIDAANADTNFAAIKALSPDSAEFIDLIAKYPDLKESVNDLLQDEGIEVLQNLQGLMTGEGSVDMSTLEDFLKDDTQRAMIVDAVDVAATDRQNTAALVEFARKGISAAANPMEEGMAFLDYADDYGIDTGPYRQRAGANLFANFWNDPKGSMLDMISSMNLPPEWANALAGIMAPFAEMAKGLADSWLNGTPTSGPGVLQLAEYYGNKTQADGAEMMEERRQQLAQTAPAPGGMG